MAAQSDFKSRSLLISYQHGTGDGAKVSTKTYNGSHDEATADQMNAFFDACEAITADTVTGKGYTDKYDVIEES